MYSHASPYLDAIQAVPGSTPGQKYLELSAIAKHAVVEAKSHGDTSTPLIVLKKVPEPLIPLVRLTIAKILRQNEVVAEALKSEDHVMVNLALRTDWFFRADNKEVINVEYFKRNLYPSITLNTRIKLIRRLAASLRTNGNGALAEEFYNFTRETYGKSQAEPLFVACSESFVWKTIIEEKIVLSRRILKNLFDKYPELVIRYLKLSKPDDKNATARNLHHVDIYKYTFLLPRLINNHLKSLIELIEMHGCCLHIKLSNKATERFLKGNIDVVLDAPILYITMMPLKVIAAKITKSQYKGMFAKVFPPRSSDFQYDLVGKYLEHYPEQERISLLLETYSKVYDANMLDNHEIINAEILKMLPTEERARQARIKLKKDPDWYETNASVENTWRCYLPLEETIETIKMEISKTSLSDKRSKLLQQMFFVCSINDDTEVLLQALRYFTTRHRNEQINVIYDVLHSLINHCDLSAFGKDHWSVMNDFLKFLNAKSELHKQATLCSRILTALIYFNLTHDLPIDEDIKFLVEIKIVQWSAKWCIFEKYPEYDRLCFDKMMIMIPCKCAEIDMWWTFRVDTIRNIAQSMADFNERNTNKSNNTKMEKLSIKNYPWLLMTTETVLRTTSKRLQWKLSPIYEYLKKWEVDLYEKWKPSEFDAESEIRSGQALKMLKADSSQILDRCDVYCHAAMSMVKSRTIAQRFVRACRWYQDIPIRFLTQCLEALSGKEADGSLVILALLMQGSELTRVMEPLVPKDENEIDIDNENAKTNYRMVRLIQHAINLVNPPVSLDFVKRFLAGDYLSLGLSSLTNVIRRSSVEKVEKFAKQLADNRVSIKKHGIRSFCLVATIADYRDFLVSLWRTEKHRSIRVLVFKTIYQLFLDNPSPENWIILKDCVFDLKIDDDDILDVVENFNDVPDAYITQYMSYLLETFERLEADGYDTRRMVRHISRYLCDITPPTSRLLTDEFLEGLLKKYFCQPQLAPDIADAGLHFAFHAYLRADKTKLDSRLQTFSNLYTAILREHWNKPDSETPAGFPINRMTHKFVYDYVSSAEIDSANVKIMKTILDSFLLVLKPQQDWTTHALLTFGIALHGVEETTAVAQTIANLLPQFVQTFSSALVIELSVIIKKLIRQVCNDHLYETALYQLIENLCRIATPDSCTLAAKLLFVSSDRRYDRERNNITGFLLNCPHPAAVSLVYQHINTFVST